MSVVTRLTFRNHLQNKSYMKKYNYVMAAILLLAILRNSHVPFGMDIVIGNCIPPMYLDFFIHFLSTDLMLFLWALFAAMYTRSIVAYVLVILGCGQVFREIVSPFGICWTDYVFQSIAAIFAFIIYAKRNLYDNAARTKYIRPKT